MSDVKIKVERTLDREFIGNVLVTAFDGNYGGCWYWAKPAGRFWLTSEQQTEPSCLDPMNSHWTSAHIRTEEPTGIAALDAKQEKGWFTVDAEAIRVGIQKILDKDTHAFINAGLYHQIYTSVLDGDADIDADAADCIVQIGLFGRIVFG